MGIMFQENSSNTNYDPEFLSKAHIYSNPTNSVSPRNNVQIHFNSSLLIIELEKALRNCNSNSPGPDGILYLFIKKSPRER